MVEPVTKYAMENIIVNSCALLLLVFLRMQHKSVKNSFVLDQKLFVVMLDLAMVQCFIEAFTNLWDKERIFVSLINNAEIGVAIDCGINMFLNVIYFSINLIFGYVWCLYAVYRMFGSPRRVKRYAKIISFPVITALASVWTTPFTGWVFTVKENNEYSREWLWVLPAVATIAYVIFGVAYIYSNRKRINKYMIMPIALIISPIFIGAIVQALLPGTAIIAMVVTISLVGLYATTQSESAYIDRLSGVYNRRYLDDYLTGLNEDERNKKIGKTITGIMLDMDKFKQINDNFGHHIGDDAISQVGKILRENLGKMNFAARYGGDEFIIITPMLDSDSIEALMQKLTDAANANNDSGEYPYELSFSYGYAQFTVGKEKDSDGFMKRMDDNMYQYKVAKKARWAAEGKITKQEEATTTSK
ncbi:MAG: GGDEF domain-containing protein [Clostridia bacterium]|nr:GGDEF domain-containing protein [Clostridia bacterium]